MFGISKDELIKNLEIIRKNLCCYYPSSGICDCKYGPALHSNELNKNILLTEHTGCPELRQVIGLLKNMDNYDFVYLCSTSNIIIT